MPGPTPPNDDRQPPALAASESATQQSEARFRLLVDSVADYAILMLDPTGHVLSWNKGAERYKGYTANEIIGRHCETFYTPEDRAAGRPARLLATALKEGHVEDEGWRLRKDGTRFWADVVITPMYDAEGVLTGFSKVTRDLTERKLAEDQRRQFKLLVENVTDYAILMLSPDGFVASWNRGAETLKGYSEAEIIGQPYERFFLPADVAAGKPRSLLARARKEGHVEDEGWRLRKDGTRFWALAVITAIYDEVGTFVGYGKVTRDLTERKMAEEQRQQFKLLVESVTDYAILMLSPDGFVTSWNRGAETLKGYSEAEILGQPQSRFYTPEDRAAGRPAQLLELATKEGHVEDEGWRVRKDGTRFWADVVITALRDEDGTLIGFAKITRDLTDRKRMEELAAQTAQLQAANKMKSEFLANMSHELRTPLNSIIGYTELVTTDDELTLDELNAGNLQTVLRNARHLLALINEILDLSKIEAGQATLHNEPFDPRQTVQTVLNTTRPLAEEKGLSIDFVAEPGVELVVSDELKLRQILLNLVGNALKFTNAGGVRLRLAPHGDQRWTISVSDTGIGIAPEHQELVFQEFRQVDASTTRERGGTGLGLAISRKLAELLEGTLTLTSTRGEGSTFTLMLPRQLGGSFEPAPGPALKASLPLSGPGVTADGRPIVLAIDDEPEVLHLIAENLRHSPYHVVTATSGESGLHLARELRPFAITLDIMMPRMDGWMTLRRLKADEATSDIPVVLLSFLENRGLAFSLGAAEYLSKPIRREELIDTLDRLCHAEQGLQGGVLVVDDDPEARTLYRQILARHGVPVTEAVDGEEALARIASAPPALVILDLMMPKVDGFEVLARLRADARTQALPVVVVTAKELTDEDHTRLASADRVLAKAGDLSRLLSQDLASVLGTLAPAGKDAP